MLENGHAVACEVRIKSNAVTGTAKEIGEHILTMLERLLAEIVAIELDQVEGAKHSGMIMVAIAKKIEDREAIPIDNNGLAINDTRPHRQGRHGGGDLWEARRKIVAVSGKQPCAPLFAPGKDSESVVLDLMNPAVAGRRRICPSRKAGLKRYGALNATPLDEGRHRIGIDGGAGRVERRNASSQGLLSSPMRPCLRGRKGG